MKTIDTNVLDTVTGGGYDQVLATLQNIQGSLADVGKTNNSLFGGQNGALLMMTMAFAFSRNNNTTVVYGGGGGGGWHHHGWGVRVC